MKMMHNNLTPGRLKAGDLGGNTFFFPSQDKL